MAATVRDLIHILQVYFSPDLSLHKALYILGLLISLYPLLRLHLNQQRQPRQPHNTAWLTGIASILLAAFRRDTLHPSMFAAGDDRSEEFVQYIAQDLIGFYQLLGLNPHNLQAPSPESLFSADRPVLCTTRTSCAFCPPADLNITPTLRRREKAQTVHLLNGSFEWVEADLVIAHCASCQADYFPDRITFKDEHNRRRQKLEPDCQYMRVSKHGIWVHRRIAIFQENALNSFHAGWSNFADWLNTSIQSERKLTNRQSQRLFIEHFSRRLLVFHGKIAIFSCPAHPSTRLLSEAVREAVGVNGGAIKPAMDHGCADCTHLKRYRDDLVSEGFVSGESHDIAGTATAANVQDPINLPPDPIANQLPPPQQQQRPPNGTPRGYTRLATMDGKTIKHKKCALDVCEAPLVNYKNGRFCRAHQHLIEKCGIVPCCKGSFADSLKDSQIYGTPLLRLIFSVCTITVYDDPE
ncbi:hypothetical protein R3P38DRAFT_2659532 [Favolaschia claudopus]|uniref:CxC5 like cysteine cluster associated with KDZ domain-containing protein n=1 Tax=Favolaschia claudopus TaxID=2862362 RepID=A0AAV9ZTK3_9AGAR